VTAKSVLAGDGWAHEVKFDDYRVQVHKVVCGAPHNSRNGHDFTDRFHSIAQLLRAASQSGSARPRGCGQRCRRPTELRQTARALFQVEHYPPVGGSTYLRSTAVMFVRGR